MYLEHTYYAGMTIEKCKTFSAKYGSHYVRKNAAGNTPAAMSNYNEKLSIRELIRILNENYVPTDIHQVLTYRKADKPCSMEEAERRVKNYIRKLKYHYKKHDIEFKVVLINAVGKKGGIHHHIVIPSIDKRLINGLWSYGGVNDTFLYPDGEYSHLGSYLARQMSDKREKEDGMSNIYDILTSDRKYKKRRWSCSRNIKRPEHEVEEVEYNVWREPPKAIKGYLIDTESIDAGTNPVTNIPYLYYRMVRQVPLAKSNVFGKEQLISVASAERWLNLNGYEADEQIRIKLYETSVATKKGSTIKVSAAEKILRELNAQKVRNEWNEHCDGELILSK